MDSIQEVILSMDQNQQKEFVYFIQRNKYRKGRKDLLLFSILKEEKERKPRELVKLLQTNNLNSYHTIRKRLFNHLADFFILKSTSSEANPSSYINGMLGVVNYLFDRGLNNQAWKYLLIAETLASQYNYSDLLNSIYLLQIEKSHLNINVSLNDVVLKYQKNQVVLRQDEQLQIANSFVRNDLNTLKKEGLKINFQQIIDNTLNSLSIDKSVLKSPRVVLNLLKIIRAGIIAKQDFFDFEPYLIENYNRVFSTKELNENNLIKADFLYMIAHTSYRNKKFEQSLNYLNQLSITLERCSSSFQQQFYGKTVHLTAANFIFLNQLDNALEKLTELSKTKQKLTIQEQLNTTVNIGIYRFLNKEYKISLKMLNELSHSDNWYKKTMGIEWVLKKNLMELILFVELEFDDLVEARIKSIERNFEVLKQNPVYKNAFNYLALIKLYVLKGRNNNVLENEISNQLTFVAYEHENIQAMAFYAWIKSKATNQNFYSTLLSLIR